MDSRISLIRPCEWEEVFLEWYKNEGENSDWNALARARGFSSWAEWRLKGYAERFQCREASWGFYEITEPTTIVREWYGGPFRTWIERYYGGKNTAQFLELAQHSELKQLKKIGSIIEEYPRNSVVCVIELANGQMHVIEGMHRVVALAILAEQQKNFSGSLVFAIGKSELSELPAVGEISQ